MQVFIATITEERFNDDNGSVIHTDKVFSCKKQADNYATLSNDFYAKINGVESAKWCFIQEMPVTEAT